MPNTGTGSATRQLAEFAASIKFSDLPADDQVRTKLRLLNVAGSVLAARRLTGARLVRSYSDTLDGGGSGSGGSSSFWLTGKRGRPEDAAFVNGMWAHLALLDDTVTHTGTMLIPAALAIAEARECSGEDVLAALAVGYEITARIEAGLMLASAVTLQGFRHSWPGVFGAAVATAKLMGLPVNGIMDTLALISTLAVPGTMAWYCNWADAEEAERLGTTGVTERYLQLGANAKNAILAASLAEGGFHGTSVALEGECGVYAVYANGMGLPPDLSYRLGEQWHLAPIGVKPYPGSWVIPVYCAERIVRQRAIQSPADVDHIRVDMVTWKRNQAVVFPGPFTNQEQALASTPFNVAATLIFGKYDVDVLARATGDTRVDELAAKITIGAMPGAVTPEARAGVVEVVFADGTSIREDASSMPSSVLRPDTWADMNARFDGMCGDESADARRAVSEYIEHFETGNARGLADLLQRPE
jgi:2-methylcitrate dehydratase PrpD